MARPVGKRSGGYVLVLVLVVCLGLVSLTLLFGHSMFMAYRGAEGDIAGRQAERAIDGAVQYAEYLMTTGTTPGYLLPDPAIYQSEAMPVGDASFWFIGEPYATTGSSAYTPAFGLVDEASKLNLNTATAAMLENLPNMTQDLAQAIVAWRTTSGTQSTASSTMGSSSISNKGGPYESVFELAQVLGLNGYDPSLLYGDDLNLNHVLDPAEDQGAGQFNPGFLEYVTVFSREPNRLSDGTARVSVATASTALRTLLSDKISTTRANQILARVRNLQIRSVLEFYIRSGMTADEFDKVSNSLTMTSGSFAVGLVNVNTASATVLACIPGITPQSAAQLVSTRSGQAQPYTNLAWVVPVLGQTAAIQAGPYLTTQTYQVTADVAAVGRNGRGYRRALFVIDDSTGTPQVVYRRNMASLGWALGPDALQTAAQQIVKQ